MRQTLLPRCFPDHQLGNGPGKLCRALQLSRQQNSLDLCVSPNLFIEAEAAVSDSQIVDGPRIGIGYAEDAIHWPLRFGIRKHPSLSKRF